MMFTQFSNLCSDLLSVMVWCANVYRAASLWGHANVSFFSHVYKSCRFSTCFLGTPHLFTVFSLNANSCDTLKTFGRPGRGDGESNLPVSKWR